MSLTMSPVGTRLAELRKARGWSQSKLAKESNLSASTIAMYETNRRTPEPPALEKLSRALGIHVDDLAQGATRHPRHSAATSPGSGGANSRDPGSGSPASTEPAANFTNGAAGTPISDDYRASDLAGKPARDITSDATATPTPTEAPNITTFSLTRDEARIILFLRMNPDCLPFVESYINADKRKRTQLETTWRLIGEFQS